MKHPRDSGRAACRPRLRSRFVRRVALSFALLLLLGVVGAATIVSALLRAAGITAALQLGGLLLAGSAGLAALLVTFWLAMRRVALPFGDVVGASERVSAGDFSVRLPDRGPPSLRSVARAFNAMTARLEDNERRRQQFMSDVAHELRTPLAVIQGRLEGIVDGIYPPSADHMKALAAEARTLARLVEDLRALANAETGELSLRKEPTDIALLLHETASGFNGRSDIEVKVDADGLPATYVDPVRLREVVANLVANGVRSSKPGSVVRVCGAATANHVTITVSDAGRGIPADRLPLIFDRFYKDPDSGGSGLGLSIARTLVHAHGGTLVARSVVGIGTTMTVTLPVAVP